MNKKYYKFNNNTLYVVFNHICTKVLIDDDFIMVEVVNYPKNLVLSEISLEDYKTIVKKSLQTIQLKLFAY